MPEYRGNLGNPLQHWVLCEILRAGKSYAKKAVFVDAHSMAPWATQRPKKDSSSALFDRVQEGLPGERSPFEVAWHGLALQGEGCPNSASFFVSVWTQLYSLLLCEQDSATALELRTWGETIKPIPNCGGFEVAEGDWRQRFRKGLVCAGDLLFVSFDPYMFDRNEPVRSKKDGNMYPEDIDLLCQSIARVSQGVVVQLTTYSANNNNPQQEVKKAVISRLTRSGLHLASEVIANGNMMSMLLARNLGWEGSLSEIATSRFEFWLSRFSGELRTVPS
jgi:hypothetical protein